MTIVTVSIQSENELSALEETLNKLGLNYHVDQPHDFTFTQEEIDSFVKTREDFIDGKTTARSWDEIEKDLSNAFD